MTAPAATIESLADAISDATGYTGTELTQATFVAATLFADIMGRRDIGDYFATRAAGIDAPRAIPSPSPASAHRAGWNFGNLTLD